MWHMNSFDCVIDTKKKCYQNKEQPDCSLQLFPYEILTSPAMNIHSFILLIQSLCPPMYWNRYRRVIILKYIIEGILVSQELGNKSTNIQKQEQATRFDLMMVKGNYPVALQLSLQLLESENLDSNSVQNNSCIILCKLNLI